MTTNAKTAREVLALQDKLADLLEGFEFWRDHKIASLQLSTLDGMLVRWVEQAILDDD